MKSELAVGTLAALAHDARLRVYRRLLAAGVDGLTVSELIGEFGTSKTTMSSHLATLAQAEVVSRERVGRGVVYRANPSRVRALSRLLVEGSMPPADG